MAVRVIVDWDLCVGNGACEAVASEIFQVDPKGKMHLRVEEIGEDLEEDAEAAVAVCPARALKLER